MIVAQSDSAGFNVENRADLQKKHGHIDVKLDDRMEVRRGPNAAAAQWIAQLNTINNLHLHTY